MGWGRGKRRRRKYGIGGSEWVAVKILKKALGPD